MREGERAEERGEVKGGYVTLDGCVRLRIARFYESAEMRSFGRGSTLQIASIPRIRLSGPEKKSPPHLPRSFFVYERSFAATGTGRGDALAAASIKIQFLRFFNCPLVPARSSILAE